MSHAGTNPAQAGITELKVTGHLMALEPGVFCVCNAPGAVPADPGTGLPGVRISAAPAAGPFPGVVTLSGFQADGWLGGPEGAVLVRVAGGPAQVMVTVYQAANSRHDAPKLQVLRVSQPAPVARPAPPVPPRAARVDVAAHVYGRGDVGGLLGDWIGDRGSRRWIEGFALAPAGEVEAAGLEYQALLGRGWLSPWTEGGQFCGSRGMSLPILGLRVRLRGAAAETHEVRLSATFVDGSVAGPVGDGEACEAESLAALESFQVLLPRRAKVERAPEPPAPVARPAGKRAAKAPPPAPPSVPAPVSPPFPAKRPPASTRRR